MITFVIVLSNSNVITLKQVIKKKEMIVCTERYDQKAMVVQDRLEEIKK